VYCDPGEYAVAEGTRSEFVCTPCLAGTFNDDSDAFWCNDCALCGSLEVVSACTPAHDTECATIGVAQTLGQTSVETVRDLVVDAGGNLWLVGEVPDPISLKITSASLHKKSPNGSATNIDHFATDGQDASLAVDAAGTIWVAGTTADDLGGSAQDNRDVYVRRYEPDNPQPITDHFGTPETEYLSDITADAAGNVWVLGDTLGDLAATNQGSRDIFLREYPAGGGAPLTRQFGNSRLEHAFGADTDSDGNVWVVGERSGDPNGGDSGTWSGLVLKFPAAGGAPTVDEFGPLDNSWMGITVDRTDRVWVVGSSNGAAIVRSYPAHGASAITDHFGANGNQVTRAVAADKQGNVWVMGWADCKISDGPISGSLDDPSSCGATQTSLGASDGFIREYPADGSAPRTNQFGSVNTDRLTAITPGGDYGVWILGQHNWRQMLWHVRP